MKKTITLYSIILIACIPHAMGLSKAEQARAAKAARQAEQARQTGKTPAAPAKKVEEPTLAPAEDSKTIGTLIQEVERAKQEVLRAATGTSYEEQVKAALAA